MKNWPKCKLVHNIQIFLCFTNFYRRFIQGFNKIAAPLTSILKITTLSNEPAPIKNDGSRSAFNKNNKSKLASEKNDDNCEVYGYGGEEHAKKLGKLKGQKSAKSQKLSKLGKSKGEKSKKLSRIGNSPNFDTTESGLSFLTPDTNTILNRLWLAFTEALILQHFDPEYHIWIKTDVAGFAISGVLSQLTSRTSPNRVFTKADLGQWDLLASFLEKRFLQRLDMRFTTVSF